MQNANQMAIRYQMAIRSARWRCSPEFFGKPWLKISDANVEAQYQCCFSSQYTD